MLLLLPQNRWLVNRRECRAVRVMCPQLPDVPGSGVGISRQQCGGVGGGFVLEEKVEVRS